MFDLTSEQAHQFAISVRASVNYTAALAIADLYKDVQSQIDARKPRCDVSGRCCHFEQYGHRLFVTTLEYSAFLHSSASSGQLNWDGLGCPYQINGLCSVHVIRPFGCRIYFCDPTAQDWQHILYEQFHERLKKLHATLSVDYFYVEWRQGLMALSLAQISASTSKAVKLTVLPAQSSK